LITETKLMKQLNRIIVMLVFVFHCQLLYSQCDLTRPKDDFSTIKKVITQEQKIINELALLSDKASWELFLRFAKIDSLLRIIVTHQCDYTNKGSGIVESIFFKFKNDSLIKKFKSIITESVREGSIYYTATVFLISKDELERFASSEIVKVRVKFRSDFDYPEVDADIKKKFSERVVKNANCLFLDLK